MNVVEGKNRSRKVKEGRSSTKSETRNPAFLYRFKRFFSLFFFGWSKIFSFFCSIDDACCCLWALSTLWRNLQRFDWGRWKKWRVIFWKEMMRVGNQLVGAYRGYPTLVRWKKAVTASRDENKKLFVWITNEDDVQKDRNSWISWGLWDWLEVINIALI